MRLAKHAKRDDSRSGLLREDPLRKEETKSNTTISDKTSAQKDIFERKTSLYNEGFEIAQVAAEMVSYLSKRALLLTFAVVSEQKAKSKLVFMHSMLVDRLLTQFTKRLQHLSK